VIHKLRVTMAVENTAGARGLLGEHGLACWVEADGRNILFDTGQGLVLSHNVKTLGIDLGLTDGVVLSHGHYDHTGGLPEAMQYLRRAVVYVHPAAFQPKFARRQGGPARTIGGPIPSADTILAHVADVMFTDGPAQIADGMWVTGEIPRRTDFEDTGGGFYLDEACQRPDPLVDDQALYIESARGTVVLLGCAHAGLVNTLDYVAELTGSDRIHAVIGGMHLTNASQQRIAKSLQALQRYDVRVVSPAHCTGLPATARMLETRPERFVRPTAGWHMEID
jgi:7,8-dihydropterin-6-yl-methyl-4-(beta-D-ribofuranosyl)aminobenzene 5'-phosphate synthase